MDSILKLFTLIAAIILLNSCAYLREKFLPEESNSLSGAGSLLTKNDAKAKSFEVLDIDQLLQEYEFGAISTDKKTFTWASNVSTNTGDEPSAQKYKYLRNELQSRIISASNQRCGYYIRTLVSSKSFTQMSWSSLSLLFSGAATVAKPITTAKAFSAGSTAAGGILSTYNDAYFNNLTLNVIASGITRQRQAQLEKISEMKTKSLMEYSVNQAISDALNYHAACNMISGLETAAAATKVVSTDILIDPSKKSSSSSSSLSSSSAASAAATDINKK